MYRLLLPAALWHELDAHLRAASPSEDGAFLLARVGRGARGSRLVVHDLLLPHGGAWEARGQHRLRPAGQWLSAVVGAAIETRSCLAFVHSHPDPVHPPSLSGLDRSTSIDWSLSLTPTLQRPFLSLVWTPRAMTGLVFEPTEPAGPQPVDRIEVLGGSASRWIHPWTPATEDAVMDDRQMRALGGLGNARLRELHVALVGAGGTGSPLAEQLVRMGVRELSLIDPDRIDTESNLRRIVGSSPHDFETGNLKVAVVARHLESLGLDASIRTFPVDVRVETAAKELLDCDVVISSTDTHSSRALVNQLAVQYSLPVLDVGVRVGVSGLGAISGMPTEVRVLLPDVGCLWCRGVLDPAAIRADNLPSREKEQEAREGYVQGVGGPQPSLAALNYFAASLASLTMLRLLAGDGSGSTSFIGDGWERYFVDRPDDIVPDCLCSGWRTMADELSVGYLPDPGRGHAD